MEVTGYACKGDLPWGLRGVRLDTQEAVVVSVRSRPGQTVPGLARLLRSHDNPCGVQEGGLLRVEGAVQQPCNRPEQAWIARWLTVLAYQAGEALVLQGLVSCLQGTDARGLPWAQAHLLMTRAAPQPTHAPAVSRALHLDQIAPRAVAAGQLQDAVTQVLECGWNAHVRLLDTSTAQMQALHIYSYAADEQGNPMEPQDIARKALAHPGQALADLLERAELEVLPSCRVFFARTRARQGPGLLPVQLQRYAPVGNSEAVYIPSLLTLRAFARPSQITGRRQAYATDVHPLLQADQICMPTLDDAVCFAQTSTLAPQPLPEHAQLTQTLHQQWKRRPLASSVPELTLPSLAGINALPKSPSGADSPTPASRPQP